MWQHGKKNCKALPNLGIAAVRSSVATAMSSELVVYSWCRSMGVTYRRRDRRGVGTAGSDSGGSL